MGLPLQVLETLEAGTPAASGRDWQCGAPLWGAHGSSRHIAQQNASREERWPRQTGGGLADRIQCVPFGPQNHFPCSVYEFQGQLEINRGGAKTGKERFCFVSTWA